MIFYSSFYSTTLYIFLQNTVDSTINLAITLAGFASADFSQFDRLLLSLFESTPIAQLRAMQLFI